MCSSRREATTDCSCSYIGGISSLQGHKGFQELVPRWCCALALQAKIMRLSGTAPAVAAAGELLEQLRSENAALQSDNERLLSYVDTLTATASGGLNSGERASASHDSASHTQAAKNPTERGMLGLNIHPSYRWPSNNDCGWCP